MKNFWFQVKKVIRSADVLLLLLDARLIDETRHTEIEEKVKTAKKTLIYCITKCDLVEKKKLEEAKKELSPCVFVSAREHHGTTILRERILIEAKKAGISKQKITVGVLGYPNVGKSSLINALKGKKSAKTSILSGCTKNILRIRADSRIFLLDTPGVIPFEEKDFKKHSMIGTIDFTKVREPDLVVMDLMQRFPGKIEQFYKVQVKDDLEETIEDIAVKFRILKKGGKPDVMRAARTVLKDWQKGVIS